MLKINVLMYFPLLLSITASVQANSPVVEDNKSALSHIPKWIEQTPTILPYESQKTIVPDVQETENLTWIDQQQKKIRHWKQNTAHQLDDWFGDTQPNEPATATLRVVLDQRWDKHESYQLDPRLRGKIKLPTLERQISVVFGDDSLDNQLANHAAIQTDPTTLSNQKNFDRKQSKENNSSIALRWSDLFKNLPFETDLDLGLRSGDDIYLRFKVMKTWPLAHDFSFHAEQMYRYGIDSKNYFRTNFELNHQPANQALLSNQLSLIVADQREEDLLWQNFTFRQHQFFAGHRFNYGLQTQGYYDNDQLRLNAWGPFVSWRQPLWREWFFIQGDVNYLNHHQDNHSHHLGILWRLETLF